MSLDEIAQRVVAGEEVNAARARGHAAMLYRFANELHIGDLVLTPNTEDATVLVGRVAREYEYRGDAPIPGHQHVRRVEWFGRLSWNELPEKVRRAMGAPIAVFKPGAQEAVTQAVTELVG
jgi:predicted Mrr-cat superfamily restriction endonuclease